MTLLERIYSQVLLLAITGFVCGLLTPLPIFWWLGAGLEMHAKAFSLLCYVFDYEEFVLRSSIGTTLVFACAPILTVIDRQAPGNSKRVMLYLLFTCAVYAGVLLYYRFEYIQFAAYQESGREWPLSPTEILSDRAPEVSIGTGIIAAILLRWFPAWVPGGLRPSHS